MITFQKKGMLTTVQDLGRIGYQNAAVKVFFQPFDVVYLLGGA